MSKTTLSIIGSVAVIVVLILVALAIGWQKRLPSLPAHNRCINAVLVGC